ncbi:hypothetical protein PILCRDRAFT_823250 [Piloderma croceum F 1598]|uniref:MTHFR SAM-binding regulatory domain-containing protein n=1 Tax=Piloderma croceum (strain F 1598) TaxID=765440 RepID=A0A0C3F4U4_PILCF|nr:hypothetical protein PILCRDRAFT_823250 [Piloderma croceum F 1598]
MKLSDKIKSCDSSRPFYTFEFFPPRTDQGFENLISRIERLSALKPIAISITWGAGGSTKDRSLALAGLTQAEYGIDTVLHLTCTNMVKGMVDDALRAAKSRGIETILALRGDPPRGEEEWIPVDPNFTHGVDLVSYIRSSREFSSYFCIGVAGYPDGHDKDTAEDAELNYLKAKVDAGADFIMTQLFYDVDGFLQWVKKVRAKGINVPIIPGIMPIQTYSSFLRLIKLCGTKVPPAISAALEPIRHDDQKVKDYGVSLAVNMIRRITTEGDIRGVHFCTLNLERSVQLVLENLHWAGGSPRIQNRLIVDAPGQIIHPPQPDSDLYITPTSAADSATTGLTSIPHTDGDAGRGELNNAASWDDFPNGRFGDYKSPAFGDQGPWGGVGITRSEAFAQWGHPKTLDDLMNLFLRHLHSQIATTPFSSAPLSRESSSILSHLEKLTRKGWWTVGSQPTVDGVSSSDEIVGWGPRGGYVFQKAFVEFFAGKEDVERIVKKVREEGQGLVDYFTGNIQGECWSNVPDGGRNAVTWGVFPGQEITQTTIIERESFLSWKDEAFSIWAEWASFYRPGSDERKLLEGIQNERWLVSLVHHDYKDPEGLWTFLFGGMPVV